MTNLPTVAQRFVDEVKSKDWTLQEAFDQFGVQATVYDEVDEELRFYEFPDGSKIGSYMDTVKNPEQVWIVDE